MTPSQLARQLCANWINGMCEGVKIDDHLHQTKFREGKCLLESGQRCPYFEEIVCQMGGMLPDTCDLNGYTAAVTAYNRVHNLRSDRNTNRKCPDCGNILVKGARLCPECRAEHHKKSVREARRS